MNRKQRPIDVDSVNAPVGGVVSGGMYRTGDLFWVAADSADAGEIVGRVLRGHISLPKAAVLVEDGDDAFFDEDNDVLTNVNSGDLLKAGKFTEDAAAEDAEAFCLFGAEASGPVSTIVGFEKGAATAVPVYSAVDPSTQTGNGSMSVSGTGAKRAGHVKVTCTTKGVVGAAVVKFQIGDETEITGVTTGAHTQIASTGIYCDFVDGLQGAGVDSFEVGDIFEFDVALEATSNKQHSVVTVNRVTPTLITDALVLRNSRIHADSDLIVGALPIAGTRTTGTPTYAGHVCYEGYAVIQFKNTSLDAENGTSKAAITVI